VSARTTTGTRLPTSGPTQPVDVILAPFRSFTSSSASSGLLLLAAAIVALIWANSAWASTYAELWSSKLSISIGELSLSETLLHWINDGLMALFFLVVGLEIKRELLVGELDTPRGAVLPIAAAVGGAVLPAVIYLAVLQGGPGSEGWGIPMATDIAFALGVLALLGSRIPLGLRVFLTALAIVDDLLAVLVIALFYSGTLDLTMLAAAAGVVAMLVVVNRLGVRHPLVYLALGVVLWLFVLRSGVHATVAGVLLAVTIPARVRLDAPAFVEEARTIIDRFERQVVHDDAVGVEEHHDELWELESVTEQAQAPLLRLEHGLQPWVAFVIVPLFALANAGVTFPPDLLDRVAEPIVLGIILGLVVGKQVGITVAAWAVVRLGRASLPEGVGWRHVYGVGWLGGIGFTMSLFIAGLGFDDPDQLTLAKIGILGASVLAGVGGYLLLRFWAPARSAAPDDRGADESEVARREGR
jgi:NhaA family Na+:H+ antiporter